MNEREAEQLKDGDILICIEAKGDVLTIGKEYGFIRYWDGYINVVNDKGGVSTYYPRRFKLKEKQMEEKKFAVGDKVKIAEKLERFPGHPGIDGNMKVYCGKEAKVTNLRYEGDAKWVRLDIDGRQWLWDVRWLSLVEDKKPLRDAKGRFIKKEAVVKPVPPKKEENKNEEKVRERLRKDVGEGSAGVASYAKQFVDGTFEMHVRDACHARINNYQIEKEIAYLACEVNGHLKDIPKDKEAAYKQFIQWIVNSPQFGPHILTKKVDECFDKGILINVQSTISQVAATCIAIRTGSEYSKILPLWKKLHDDGVDGFVAWIVATMFQQTAAGKYQVSGNGGGHHVWSDNIPLKNFVEVKNNGLRKVEDGPYAKAGAQRYHVFATFGGDRYGYIRDEAVGLKLAIKKHMPKLFEAVAWDKPANTVSYKDIIILCDKLFG